MLDPKILIGKLLSVDGFSSGTVALSEVSTLDHEARDDTVKTGTPIAEPMLTGGKLMEVAGSLGDLAAVEAHDDAAEGLTALLNVEVDFLGDGSVAHYDDCDGLVESKFLV
jgi:hypothetical protein